MNKIYFFLIILLFHPFCLIKADIKNDILKTKSGNIIPNKDYYQHDDLLEFTYLTPTVDIQTGGWGWWQEDKVEKSTTKIILDVKYNNQVIRLATYKEQEREKGHDITLSAQSGKYVSDVSIDKLLGINQDSIPDQFYFTVYLTYHIHADFNEGKSIDADMQEKKEINVYKCKGGEIMMDISVLPNISPSNASPIYGLYNSNNNIQYAVVSPQNPVIYNLKTDQWISWNVTDGDNLISKKEVTYTSNMPDFDQYLKYTDFLNSQNILKNGSIRYVYRTYSNKDFSCHSNTIKIEAIDTLSIDGFEENETEQFICATTDIVDDEEDLSCNSNYVFTIRGKSVNWQNVSYPDSIYGIKYGWEYKTSSNLGWQTVTENLNSDVNNPDLCLRKDFVKQGKKYYFRQFVLVTKFGNRKVYANGEHNHITIQHYQPISKNNFSLNPLPEICEGTILKDTLSITFIPEKDKIYKNAYNTNLYDSTYNMKFIVNSDFEPFNAEMYSDKLSIPFILQGKSKIEATISVMDGCFNTISFPISLNISNQPQLSKANIDVEGGYAIYSGKENQTLPIQVPEGKNITIKVNDSDSEKSSCRYFISYRTNEKNEEGEFLWGERSLINTALGHTISYSIKNEKWFNTDCNYIKLEKENITTNCISEPLYLCINFIGNIHNNSIGFNNGNDKEILYTCKNNKNDLILGELVSGGYGDSTYSYVWQYSNDNISWINMLNTEGKTITSVHLPENCWNKVIDQNYYFRRMVTSLGKDASESSAIKSYSNVVQIKPYSRPQLQLIANQKENDLFACFESKVTLSQNYLNQNILEEGYAFKKFYGYENNQGIILPYIDHRNTILVTSDTTIYAATEFCGDTIFSEKGIHITTGEDLTIQENEINLGSCLVRGDSIELSIDVQPNYTYGFIFNQDTIKNANAKVYLPLMGNLNYIVFKSKEECTKFTPLSILQTQTKEPIGHTQLKASSSGSTFHDNVYNICYGNVVEIFSPNEKTSDDIQYEWKINNSIINTAYTSNTISTAEFDLPGKDYIVTRTSYLMSENISCQHVTDSIKIHTFPIISNLSLSVDKDSICYGDNVSVSVNSSNIQGGSGSYLFAWNEVHKDTTLTDKFSTSIIYHSNELYEPTAYSVTASDVYCTHDIYRHTSPSKVVYVEKDLTFTAQATPSTINAQSIEDGSSMATNITSNDISASERISCWLNNKEVKNHEAFLNGINYSLKSTDFSDNIATFTIERYGTNLKECKHSSQVDILLNEGFDGMPIVLSSHSLTSSTSACGGDSILLSIDENQLPKYDNKNIESSSFTYQWYKKNGDSWSTCGSSSNITVIAISDETQEYRCKLSYTPQGGTKQSVLSNIHSVIGMGSTPINSISFLTDDSHSKIHYVCKGESGLLTLTADSPLQAVQYQWYQKIGDSSWEKVPTTRGTTGTDSPLCTIDLENYNQNTSFKLTCVNQCGTTSESINQIQLLFNVGASLSETDITLTSSNIYEGLSLPSVSLCVPKDYNNTYFWSCDPSFSSTSWKSGNPITLDNNGKGFTSGNDSVFIYMVSKGNGNCLSDTIAFHFNVFEKIKAGNINSTTSSDTLCPNNGMMTLSVNEIKGGDESYQIDWMYKSQNMNSFSVINEQANMPFEYLGTIDGANALGAYSFLNIGNLSESCEFYAVISCNGNYTGRNYSTNSCVKGVYQPLKSGSIDNTTQLLCYNNALSHINGSDATGGDHQYSYQWLKSTDKEHWEPINEQTEVSYLGQSSQEKYKLKQSTYFCRITNDGCGNKDTSAIKTVQVKSEVTTQPNDILYTPLIPRGDKANMWGIEDEFNYIWFNRDFQILDTTTVRELFSTDNINEPSRTYYVKTLYDDCVSSNYDTIHISTYDIDGGHLSFDDAPSVTKKYWICSGAKAGRISADGGGNLNYRWFYLINGTENSRAYTLYSATNTTQPVTSSSVLLDTCNLSTVFTNATGTQLEKKISFFRVSYFTINGVEQTENSDTISVYIVPTLNLAATLLTEGSTTLAGTITTEKELYCNGETGGLIDGTVPSSSSLYEIWSNGTFGPYLYDTEYPEFQTWFEYGKNNHWSPSEIHYGIADYAQFFNLNVIDTTYMIRRAFSDGCSTSYSNTIKQNLSDKIPNPSKIIVKATTPEGKVISDGIEMGDALSINYTELGYDCYWFSNEECTDTLASKNQLITFDKITEKTPTTIYLKRKDNTDDGCFSSALAIPLTFNTKSSGGHIYKDQHTCRNQHFSTITNGQLAEGFSYAPMEGIADSFSYQWQICINEDLNIWNNINNATDPDSLSSKTISTLMKDNISTYYIRRKATNSHDRIVYSDTIKLSFYDEFKAGTISLENNEEKTSFCYSDSLPSVLTATPTGGYFGFAGFDGYSYGWEISANNQDYIPVSQLSNTTSRKLDLDYFIRYTDNLSLDMTQDNIIHVRAIYADECNVLYSKPITFTLWAKTTPPSIYQVKDSCESDAVTIKAYDTQEYFYTWVVLNDEKQITWSYTQDSLKLQRVSEMNVTEYGVFGTQKTSGCKSNFTYFNIDSLPVLHQESLSAPSSILCYGSSTTILGGKISGGNGTRNFLWEYSYDGKKYKSIAETENLSLSNLKKSIYVRRIINDQCSSDTSNTILIKVREKLSISSSDISYPKNVCTNQPFTIKLNAEKSDSLKELNSFLHVKECLWTIQNTSSDDTSIITLSSQSSTLSEHTYQGFEGPDQTFSAQFHTIDSLGNICYSDKIFFSIHNSTPLDSSLNIISYNNVHPCNGEIIPLKGSDPYTYSLESEEVNYAWFQSVNQKEWIRIPDQSDKDLFITVQDTMFFKREIYNQCQSNFSNIISLKGNKSDNIDYASLLNLTIITYINEESDSVEWIIRNHDIETDYDLYGDDELPLKQYGITPLPYTAEEYANKGLYLHNTTGCYNSYRITPIRGGRIYSEGEIIVCEGSDVPTLRVTKTEGGTGVFQYQWQYKNEYVKEYVNIPSATEIDYTPEPVNTQTWFRRMTTSGEYVSYSNEISLSIAESPQTTTLQILDDNESLDNMLFKRTNNSAEISKSMSVTLIDSFFNATNVYWEYSDDQIVWQNLQSVNPTAESTSLIVTGDLPSRYYRLTAENNCGITHSNDFFISTSDVPEILEEEVIIQNLVCQGDTLKFGCFYKNEEGKLISGDYSYLYENNAGFQMYTAGLNGLCTDIYYPNTPINGYIYCPNVTAPFDMTVTRISNTTDASYSTIVHIPVNILQADFEFSVNNQTYSTQESCVYIEQGDLVEFKNLTDGNLVETYWELIEPENTPQNIPAYGLYSFMENPDCYFYNGGNYNIKLSVTDINGCHSTISNNAITIPFSAVKNSSFRQATFVEKPFDENDKYLKKQLKVFPTHFSNEITIQWKDHSFSYQLYDGNGSVLLEGYSNNEVKLNTENLIHGTYLLKVDNHLLKLIK